MLTLRRVRAEDRTLLYNLNQKYLYEMTNYYPDELDAAGNLTYGNFDAYFQDPARSAWLILTDGNLAGFAMVHPYGYFSEPVDHVLAEFTVFPMYRRRHLASEAAQRILLNNPGVWEIKYHQENPPAKALWHRITAPFQPEMLRYSSCETVLRFRVPESGERSM